MGRPKKQNREPFWRTDRACWYVQHGTRQIRLDADKDRAWRLWHEFMAKPPEARAAAPKTGPAATVIEILDAFLEWTKTHQAEKTYTWHRDHIQNFVNSIPNGLTVGEVKVHHVTAAMDAHANWSASTKNGFARSVQRGFRWTAHMASVATASHTAASGSEYPTKKNEIIRPRKTL